jgi:hypothetical protein
MYFNALGCVMTETQGHRCSALKLVRHILERPPLLGNTEYGCRGIASSADNTLLAVTVIKQPLGDSTIFLAKTW